MPKRRHVFKDIHMLQRQRAFVDKLQANLPPSKRPREMHEFSEAELAEITAKLRGWIANGAGRYGPQRDTDIIAQC